MLVSSVPFESYHVSDRPWARFWDSHSVLNIVFHAFNLPPVLSNGCLQQNFVPLHAKDSHPITQTNTHRVHRTAASASPATKQQHRKHTSPLTKPYCKATRNPWKKRKIKCELLLSGGCDRGSLKRGINVVWCLQRMELVMLVGDSSYLDTHFPQRWPPGCWWVHLSPW